MESLVGQLLLNRYRVEAFIGRGGMADVYRVLDQVRAVPLAMKVLHGDLAEDKVFIRRFRREAQTLANLQHPNIVRFYGLEEDQRLVFMLMDFIDGTSLRAEIARTTHPLPGAHILGLMRPICSALNYAHQMGIVHCDIKPANILIDATGKALLSDFGISRMVESATTTTLTGAGTPAYMAPEQIRGLAVAPQTDLYAIGIILYEMLTGGERPFTGETGPGTGSTVEKVRWEHLNQPPVFPQTFLASTPPEAVAVVMRCLEKDPGKRFASAMHLLKALEAAYGIVGGPTVWLEETPLPRSSPAATVPFPLEPTPSGSPVAQGYAMPQRQVAASTPYPAVTTPYAPPAAAPKHGRAGWLLGIAGLLVALVVIACGAGFWLLRSSPDLWNQAVGLLGVPAATAIADTPPPQVATESPALISTETLPPTEAPTTAVTEPTEAPSLTPVEPTPIGPRVFDFSACSALCDGTNALTSYPGGSTKIYFQYSYDNIPSGAHYIRKWSVNGNEWVRYDCSWDGPSSGIDTLTLTEPDGLYSGPWEITIQVDDRLLLREQVLVKGNWTYWHPAGIFDTCHGKK